MDKIKIVLIDSDGEYKRIESNKGAEAVLISSIDILRRFFPNAEFITTMQLSENLSQKVNCKVIRNKVFSVKTYSIYTSLKSTTDLLRCICWRVLQKYLKFDLNFLISSKKLKEYYGADVIVHLGMDLYSDDFGTRTIIEHSKDILLGIVLGKPVVVWAESLGPFRSKLTKYLVKFTLDRVSLITVREEMAKKHLEELGIDRVPIYSTADPAFLLEPTSKERVGEILQENGLSNVPRPLIGMSLAYLAGEAKKSKITRLFGFIAKTSAYVLPDRLSKIMLERGKRSAPYSRSRAKYARVMAQIADWLVEEFDSTVFFVPHEEPLIGEDIHKEIWERVKHKDNIVLMPYNLKAEEIKGIIGQSDLFIGGKMHANIAALSQCIPTVGLSYSYKFQGIMALVGHAKYVSDSITFEDVTTKVKDIWNTKDETKSEFRSKVLDAKRLALLNGELVKELLDSRIEYK